MLAVFCAKAGTAQTKRRNVIRSLQHMGVTSRSDRYLTSSKSSYSRLPASMRHPLYWDCQALVRQNANRTTSIIMASALSRDTESVRAVRDRILLLLLK